MYQNDFFPFGLFEENSNVIFFKPHPQGCEDKEEGTVVVGLSRDSRQEMMVTYGSERRTVGGGFGERGSLK